MKNALKYYLILGLAAVVLTGFGARDASAAWGDFDPNFGFLGAALDAPTDHYPSSVAVQPDGKILVTGYRKSSATASERFFLRRYLSNGRLDASFGSDGAAVANSPIALRGDYRGVTIAVQPDGKIAVAGVGNGYYAVWRFNANGSSDTTFGNGGLRTLSNYPGTGRPQIAAQKTKLVVAVPTDSPVVLLRLNANGSTDTTFGSTGAASTDILGFTNFYVFVESGTNNVTIGGAVGPYQSGAERFLASGQPDPSFVPTAVNGSYYGGPGGFVRLADQKYVFQGVQPVYDPNGQLVYRAGLMRLDAAGASEPYLLFQTGADDNNCPQILAQQSDGRVVSAGIGRLYRFNSALDVNSAAIGFCSSFNTITAMTRAVLQPDDKMLVAGRYDGTGNLMLVRTLPD
jgi:uncharacterized delta-60 repeat protein